ncbi:MAG: DEAD/DEAH box helicase [candidate division KSB1 bacterium]|nr:DEAD/DEAH box helicase [candidate division KSB1 bacterium]
MNPGTIVRCRNRDWVLLPGDGDVYLLRPLAGTSDEIVAIHRQLATLVGYALPEERVTPSTFPWPTAEDVSDAASAHLLWQAARLTLRDTAAPFRSFGRISIRPRVYQLVPLLMALRLHPVRLFIADDVGIGKTIEALLVARELYDRGEIRRLCVLCPPYLCEQWARELADKFNLEPTLIRSGTVGQLERRTPPGKSLYECYPVQVASIDFVKSDRHRHLFLHFCPELVIVDEVHGAAEAAGKSQQERHALLREIARDPHRHLILLTATPHSGISDAFRSLLGLLRPEFASWNVADLTEAQRKELARHFVQRTRADIQKVWETTGIFPKRETVDETYTLSAVYRELFDKTYEFCSEIVWSGRALEERRRRVRYWGALALLRCVMSSPAAAMTALTTRAGFSLEDNEETDLAPFVFESAEDRTDDETPTLLVETASGTLVGTERHRLRELARRAAKLHGSTHDTKLSAAIHIVQDLLRQGFNPILWCRYVATAEYVAEKLAEALPAHVQVVCITGRMGDEERQAKIEELETTRQRVLVATDCLSEGINLQDKFTAVLHYDLPWNPNRLEQREGRVDRFGQQAERVKAVRFFGRDNPIDGVVIRVLLDKAREIHRTLGTHVPVPQESESVTQAVLEALFLRTKRQRPGQLVLDLEVAEVQQLHSRWDESAERERVNRTRFAQRAMKPQEVHRELEASDSLLGDPDAVRDFVLTAAQRLGLTVAAAQPPGVFRVAVAPEALQEVPDPIRLALPMPRSGSWFISFDSPTPAGAEYIGRNHRFVAALATYLVEEALSREGKATASRCGVVRTRAVAVLTTILLLRVRYLLEQPPRSPLLSEEVLVVGYRRSAERGIQWLDDQKSLHLLAGAKPDANVPLPEKQELVRLALQDMGDWGQVDGQWGGQHPIQAGLAERMARRALELEQAHKRLRQAALLSVKSVRMKPQLPPDLLGLLVLQPVVGP